MRSGTEGLAIILAVGYLFYDSIAAGLIFIPYVFFHVRKRVATFEMRRCEKTALSFKDGMQAVVAALTAGYSIENAFRESLCELEILYGKKSDIYRCFAKIINQLSLNVNIEEAFADFAGEVNVEEISRFAEVLNYAKKSGGNLIAIIKNTTDSISEKIDVKREINTVISAKKLEQNIMTLVPAGIILYMRLTNGGMFGKLYGNAFGIAVMSVCLGIFLAAKLLADHIVDIRV